MRNDFQLDLFQLSPAEFRTRYALGLKDYNDATILAMRASATKPSVLLAAEELNSFHVSVSLLDATSIVTHIVLFPSWDSSSVKTVYADSVPFSSSPAVSGATIYVHGGRETRVDGNFNNVENGTITGSDTCSVLFYGYTPASV